MSFFVNDYNFRFKTKVLTVLRQDGIKLVLKFGRSGRAAEGGGLENR